VENALLQVLQKLKEKKRGNQDYYRENLRKKSLKSVNQTVHEGGDWLREGSDVAWGWCRLGTLAGHATGFASARAG